MFPAGIIIMARIVKKGPIGPSTDDVAVESGRPQAPVHALSRQTEER
jgi:hypothetical protein